MGVIEDAKQIIFEQFSDYDCFDTYFDGGQGFTDNTGHTYIYQESEDSENFIVFTFLERGLIRKKCDVKTLIFNKNDTQITTEYHRWTGSHYVVIGDGDNWIQLECYPTKQMKNKLNKWLAMNRRN